MLLSTRELVHKAKTEYKADTGKSAKYIVVSPEFMAMITNDVVEEEELTIEGMLDREIYEFEGLQVAVNSNPKFYNFLVIG